MKEKKVERALLDCQACKARIRVVVIDAAYFRFNFKLVFMRCVLF